MYRKNQGQIQFFDSYKEFAQSQKKSKKKKAAAATPLVLKVFGVTVNELGYATEDEDILKIWALVDDKVGSVFS